jgi:hypothetical protein
MVENQYKIGDRVHLPARLGGVKGLVARLVTVGDNQPAAEVHFEYRGESRKRIVLLAELRPVVAPVPLDARGNPTR